MDFREITEFIRDFMGYIIFILVLIIIFTFVIGFNPIAGNSMVPSLEEGEVLLVSKFHPNLIDVKREDIVIIKKGHKSYIKRVIGLPDETVYVKDNELYINDKVYNEPYLEDDIVNEDFSFTDICSIDKCPDNKIPKDMYLVLGDNRENSEDSRDFGLISKEEIKGVGIFKIWPLNRFGKI